MKKTNLLKSLATVLIVVLALGLRLWQVGTLLPPYWEEAALGYDGYSIAQTLHDHHGHFLPLVAFESFGDWKPSGYFYAVAVSTKIFGLSVWSVRLPSVLAGVMIVLGIGGLANQLKKKLKLPSYFPWLSMLIAAINPWAILFSRAAWEVNLATALLLWGVVVFIQFLEKQAQLKLKTKLIYLLTAVTLLVVSTYTYHATRMIAPILGLGLVLWWSQTQPNLKTFVQRNFKLLLLLLGWSLLLMTPFLLSLTQNQVTQRFAETSIFSNLEPIVLSNQLNHFQPGWLGKITAHRYLWWGRELIHNYLTHFDFKFLFISGDGNPRHSIQYLGLFYPFDFILLLAGLYLVFKNIKNKQLQFLLFWLVIGIVPASLTMATPHALRILPTLPVWIIIISLGVTYLLGWLKKINLRWFQIGWVGLIGIYVAGLLMFWQFYTQIYPVQYAGEWQTGYQQVMTFLGDSKFAQQTIYVTRQEGRPAMYYWFFNQIDPTRVQATAPTAKSDQGELLEFENLEFINGVGEVKTLPALVATSPEMLTQLKTDHPYWKFETLLEVPSPVGKTVWQVDQITN